MTKLSDLDCRVQIIECPNNAVALSLTRKIDNHPFASQYIFNAKQMGVSEEQFALIKDILKVFCDDISMSLANHINRYL